MTRSTLPTISLGGTHKDFLFAQNRTALDALREARHHMVDAEPHMRDYIGRDADYRFARASHVVRLEQIDLLIAHYSKVVVHVAANGGK